MKFVTVKRTASKLSQAIIILGIYINTSSQFIYTGNCGYGEAVFLTWKTFLNKIFKEIKIAISFGKDTNYLFNELILYYYFIEGFR